MKATHDEYQTHPNVGLVANIVSLCMTSIWVCSKPLIDKELCLKYE